MFGHKNESIEKRYVDYKIEENKCNEIIEYRLTVKNNVIALVSISTDKEILSNDYVESEDLRFLLLQIIDKFKTLKYKGDELCILEYGINIKFEEKLAEEVIITRESILDVKSFQYTKDLEIGNTLI